MAQLRSRFANRSRLVEPARDARPGDRARGADLGTAWRSSPGGLAHADPSLDCLANQGLLDLAAGGGFVVKEFTLADILGRHRSARVTGGHGGAPHCGRAHSRFVNWTPLRRLRDEGCDPGSRHRFVCPLSGPERAFPTNVGRPRQQSHVAVDDKTGSGTPVGCPERLVLAGSMLPRAAEGSAWRMNRTRPWWKRSRSVREPPPKAPAREHSLMSRTTSKPLSTVDSVASSVPGAPWVKLAGAV